MVGGGIGGVVVAAAIAIAIEIMVPYHGLSGAIPLGGRGTRNARPYSTHIYERCSKFFHVEAAIFANKQFSFAKL